MDINTKEFWLKVKEEYKPEEQRFICNTSDTFKNAWQHEEFDIKRYASVFLENKDEFIIGESIVFRPNYYTTDYDKIKIRKQFIDYMINKFS